VLASFLLEDTLIVFSFIHIIVIYSLTISLL